MRSMIILGLALGLSAVGCDNGGPKPADDAKVANAPADNSKKNERDQSSATLARAIKGRTTSIAASRRRSARRSSRPTGSR